MVFFFDHITVLNHDEPYLLVESTGSGEYQSRYTAVIDMAEKDLQISALETPNFIIPNDKLSAHKIASFGVVIHVPSNMKLRVNAGCMHHKGER